MLKWLTKFTLEIAPPIAATVIGAFVVHQLWPTDKTDVTPPATPPAAQVTTDSPKAASTTRQIGTKSADAPATSGEAPVTATVSPTSTGKSARQSSDVAKIASNPPLPPARENVFERAEKALAAIPRSRSSTPPAQPSAPAPTTAVVPLPPTPPSPPSAQDTASVSPVTEPPATSTAAVAPMAPPPMDPPREIASPASIAAPPPPPQVAPHDRNPLRVYRSDRANLADIPMADGDDMPPPPETAAAQKPEPQAPPREKNIVENILGGLHSVLPERLR
jgi:hypothetical protein